MALIELLSFISKVCKDKGISTPFIVGGVPRDKLLNRLDHIVDIDITTGDNSIHSLGIELSKIPNSNYLSFPDGHSQIKIGQIKLDLSSNFRVPDINKILQTSGINKPSEMKCEIYSRDFTCNSLLMSLDLKKIYDPTGMGVKDIRDKVIRTCLPAHLTLGSQHKRVVRVIYLAAKLGFEVDSEIISWVKQNTTAFSDAKPKFIADKLQQAKSFDLKKTIHLLQEMNLREYVSVL